MTPKISANVAWQVVEGEAIVVDLASGKTVGLNPSGTFLWTHIDGGHDVAALASALAGEFSLSREEAASDTDAFLTEMTTRMLIVDAEAAG
ncbi:MAG TPA: PqqD family protein [Thermoanaerobaculia bacterium]|nr:PqqD family protein [Thermoanaerobaculia bacterium]